MWMPKSVVLLSERRRALLVTWEGCGHLCREEASVGHDLTVIQTRKGFADTLSTLQ